MTLRCRKGDMAIMVVGPHSGYIVDVLEYIGNGSCDKGSFNDLWYVAHGKEERNPLTGKRWVARDSSMLPIHPGDLHETEETEKELTV
jgi:hypothetical protein